MQHFTSFSLKFEKIYILNTNINVMGPRKVLRHGERETAYYEAQWSLITV
jgi:hypothetical protein